MSLNNSWFALCPLCRVNMALWRYVGPYLLNACDPCQNEVDIAIKEFLKEKFGKP